MIEVILFQQYLQILKQFPKSILLLPGRFKNIIFQFFEVILFQYYLQILILFIYYYCQHILKILFSDFRSNTISILFRNFNTIYILFLQIIIALSILKHINFR